MKIVGSILVIVSICFFLCGCSQPGQEPCSFWGDSAPPRHLGMTKLDSSCRSWMRMNNDTIHFINSNGGKFSFIAKQYYGEVKEESLGEEPYESRCWKSREKIYSKVSDGVVLISEQEVAFDIFLERMVSINKANEESIKNPNAENPEKVNFTIGKAYFSFDLRDSTSAIKGQYAFFDSTYSDIMVCENKEIKQGVYPTKFLLQRNIGLVGFELSNKEQWKRQ